MIRKYHLITMFRLFSLVLIVYIMRLHVDMEDCESLDDEIPFSRLLVKVTILCCRLLDKDLW